MSLARTIQELQRKLCLKVKQEPTYRKQQRLRGWLVHKHRVGGRGECRYPAPYNYKVL